MSLSKVLANMILILTLSAGACLADVGDVYYCSTDKFVVYNKKGNSLQQDNTNRKFKFKWEADRIVFGEGFIFAGSLYPDENTGNEFGGDSFQVTWRQQFAFFNEPNLTFLSIIYPEPRRIVFASCDKF